MPGVIEKYRCQHQSNPNYNGPSVPEFDTYEEAEAFGKERIEEGTWYRFRVDKEYRVETE
jgi:hypothetical protein